MRRANVTFPCGDITLEGAWHLPEGSAAFPVVVVCHPHPLQGGSMSNNVVFALCRELSRQRVAALRFNFRGVGRSEGRFGKGVAEQEDVKAALTFVSSSPEVDPERVGLAGYSFGGGVSLPVALQDERVSGLALISPALEAINQRQFGEYTKPKFLIVGDRDFLLPFPSLLPQIQDVLEPGQYQVISGADHFWRGYESELAQKVTRFFTDGFSLKAP